MKLLWGELKEGMEGTPDRVVRYWVEMSAGLTQDPSAALQKVFPCDYNQVVLERGIEFTSLCEHHLLPFSGVAHIAYIPDGAVAGLSKIPRTLDILATQPQIQERLTEQVGELIFNSLSCKGVIVILEAEHACMSCRGIRKSKTKTVTVCVRGVFEIDPVARSEVMALIRG